MRVAGRRLRVALPLLVRKPEGRRARRRLREMRDGRGAETLALIAAIGEGFDPLELHRLRRQLRRLRYAAELSGTLKGQVAAAAADFRALQDELGRLHDTYVLSEWLR